MQPAPAGGVATSATALMRDRVTAVATGGTELRLELERSGPVAWSAVKALN